MDQMGLDGGRAQPIRQRARPLRQTLERYCRKYMYAPKKDSRIAPVQITSLQIERGAADDL